MKFILSRKKIKEKYPFLRLKQTEISVGTVAGSSCFICVKRQSISLVGTQWHSSMLLRPVARLILSLSHSLIHWLHRPATSHSRQQSAAMYNFVSWRSAAHISPRNAVFSSSIRRALWGRWSAPVNALWPARRPRLTSPDLPAAFSCWSRCESTWLQKL